MTATQNTFTDPDLGTALNEALSFMTSIGPQRVVTIFFFTTMVGMGNLSNNFTVVYWQD